MPALIRDSEANALCRLGKLSTFSFTALGNQKQRPHVLKTIKTKKQEQFYQNFFASKMKLPGGGIFGY